MLKMALENIIMYSAIFTIQKQLLYYCLRLGPCNISSLNCHNGLEQIEQIVHILKSYAWLAIMNHVRSVMVANPFSRSLFLAVAR